MESQTAAQMAGSQRIARQHALLVSYAAAAKAAVARLEDGIGYGYEHTTANSNALFEITCLIEGCVQQWGIGQAEVDGTLPEASNDAGRSDGPEALINRAIWGADGRVR